jgi:membrane protease subunit HflC
LVLRPDSDFFRYFSDPAGRSNPDSAAAPPAPAPASPAASK